MLRRIPRFLRVSIVFAIVAAVTLTVYQSWSTGAVGTGGWTQTQWGPLGPADRDLLVKVRQANLWEGPTSQQAAQQASSPAVRSPCDRSRKISRRVGSDNALKTSFIRMTWVASWLNSSITI